MNEVKYPWNPYQKLKECIIKDEVVTVPGGDKIDIIPRYAPFHTNEFILVDYDTGDLLTEGVDYVFGLPFATFNTAKNVSVSGSVEILSDVKNKRYLIKQYSTVGDPFVLSDIAFAELLGNINHSTRKGTWEQVVNLPPGGFPGDPHPHAAKKIANFDDLVSVLERMNEALGNELNNPTVMTDLVKHAKEALRTAHPGTTKGDVELDLVANYRPVDKPDLKSGSNELYMTLGFTHDLVMMMLDELKLLPDQNETNPGEGEGEAEKPEFLTLNDALGIFLSQEALLSEIKLLGKEAQATARMNLGLGTAATSNVVNVTGQSTVDVPSQKLLTDLIGNISFDATSWTYIAKGGESTLQPPYKFLNALVFIDGLGQPSVYAFTVTDGVINLPTPLMKDELVEVVMDAPMTKSWFYESIKGGEEKLSPPYKLNNVLVFINGFEQVENYSFNIEKNEVILAEPLRAGEVCEVVLDAPLTSQNALYVNEQVEKLQVDMEVLRRRLEQLRGVDFLSVDDGQVVRTGTDENIYMNKDDLQYIQDISVDVKETKE